MRAVPFFKKEGVNVEVFDSIAILQEKRPSEVGEYIQSELYKKTVRQDMIVQTLQTFPVLSPLFSRILYQIARHQRDPQVLNPYVKTQYYPWYNG